MKHSVAECDECRKYLMMWLAHYLQAAGFIPEGSADIKNLGKILDVVGKNSDFIRSAEFKDLVKGGKLE